MTEELSFFTDGAAYERQMGRWSQAVGAVFLDWLAPPQGRRWLDVGCGNGAFCELLQARCPPAELYGIDPSDAQLAYARKRVAAKSAHFQTGDAQALPFDDASFDVATMALVISFIPDPGKAVAEMARVVRPGGRVATYMWDAPGGGFPYHPVMKAARELGFAGQTFSIPGANVYSQSAMRSLWEQAGLTGIETRRIDITVTFADLGDFLESGMALATPAKKMIDSLSPTDRKRLEAHLDASLPRNDTGRVAFGAFANAVKGRVRG